MQYKEREDVVVEYRAMKERQRRKEEHIKKQNQSATKVRKYNSCSMMSDNSHTTHTQYTHYIHTHTCTVAGLVERSDGKE